MKVLDISRIAEVIKDGDNVAVSGFSKSGMADYTYAGIAESFLKTGHPAGIWFICNALGGSGEKKKYNDRFWPEGLVAGARIAHIQLAPGVRDQIESNKIPGYMYPLGVMAQLYRDMGAGKPGTISKVGLGTFIDPRQEGGRMNDLTTEDVARLIEIDGEEWLFYPKFPIDVAIFKATYSDEKGNVSMENEPSVSDALYNAKAAKQNGGIVIAQVEDVVKTEDLMARNIEVPASLVDYVIIAPKELAKQTILIDYDPVLCQKERQDLSQIPPRPLDIRKIIARRAAMEIREGDVVNLGYGIPEVCGDVAAEEGISEQMTLTVEGGVMGGVPGSGLEFGTARNAEYVCDMAQMMDYYDGGGLDISVLGFGEIDEEGNVNASKFGSSVGPGGFINISCGTKRNVFCGSLTAVGLKVSAGGGKLRIDEEGKKKKFVKKVEQITFNAQRATHDGHEIIYITERAVFRERDGKVLLTEVAPGIDLQTQVLDQIEFDVQVADDLKEMDPRIFTDEPMGL